MAVKRLKTSVQSVRSRQPPKLWRAPLRHKNFVNLCVFFSRRTRFYPARRTRPWLKCTGQPLLPRLSAILCTVDSNFRAKQCNAHNSMVHPNPNFSIRTAAKTYQLIASLLPKPCSSTLPCLASSSTTSSRSSSAGSSSDSLNRWKK